MRPPTVDEWLPGDHLARFIVEAVHGLDLRSLEKAYAGRGSAAYHPSVLLSLLIYGYATGVFSGRKIERLLTDNGFTSTDNIEACEARNSADSGFVTPDG